MPGFRDTLGENKMWQISILLKNADKISPGVKAELAGTTPAAPASAPPAAAPPKN